ncbi:hypothetical protein RRG08_057980 [Elysia crispata]|uniref:Uncharacterized protein n=1 Tax=Elysia crispata TaxID=231223 RepID=A0AAE1DXJ7_9GAST|nr:hypothetical protein RRG08_057980 [Elysia crispata]
MDRTEDKNQQKNQQQNPISRSKLPGLFGLLHTGSHPVRVMVTPINHRKISNRTPSAAPNSQVYSVYFTLGRTQSASIRSTSHWVAPSPRHGDPHQPQKDQQQNPISRSKLPGLFGLLHTGSHPVRVMVTPHVYSASLDSFARCEKN